MSLGEQFDEVLAAAQAGAEWALTALYQDLHRRVLGYLLSQDPAAGEDLASDVWLDVASGLTGFAGNESALRAWVFTIARRRLLDHRRRVSRRKTSPQSLEELAFRGPTGNVEDEALAGLGTTAALATIAALPHDQAEVVLLRVLGGLSANEVGAILGKRAGAVRALQYRALKQLARTVSREAVTE